jgi:hypothetical protein
MRGLQRAFPFFFISICLCLGGILLSGVSLPDLGGGSPSSNDNSLVSDPGVTDDSWWTKAQSLWNNLGSSDPSSGGSDSGSWDWGGSDGGSWDSGGSDSGSWDWGGSDGGSWDSGGSDSGSWDSGGSDGGSWDSGGSDDGSWGGDSGGSDSGSW